MSHYLVCIEFHITHTHSLSHTPHSLWHNLFNKHTLSHYNTHAHAHANAHAQMHTPAPAPVPAHTRTNMQTLSPHHPPWHQSTVTWHSEQTTPTHFCFKLIFKFYKEFTTCPVSLPPRQGIIVFCTRSHQLISNNVCTQFRSRSTEETDCFDCPLRSAWD